MVLWIHCVVFRSYVIVLRRNTERIRFSVYHLWIKCIHPKAIKNRSVSMEITTDLDQKDGFVDRYDAKTDRFRWKQPQIWIKTMVLWIGTIQKDGFVDRCDPTNDRFRWK
eukprot:762934_1